MGRKSKYTIEEKVEAVNDYRSGKQRITQICNDLKVRDTTLYKWISIYNKYGKEGFQAKEISPIR